MGLKPFKQYCEIINSVAVNKMMEKKESCTKRTMTDKKLRGFGPLANYADRATAACCRSSANFCG
jgi:hypothetical protein